jgi:muramoyltetrapeptide carboxypeptidase
MDWSMPARLAPPLRPGDRVGLVAASSALDSGEALEAGMAVLRGWGLQVQPGAAALVGRRWGYLAGKDAERRGDLLRPSSTAVASATGAEGGAEGTAGLRGRSRSPLLPASLPAK